jgi:hypothetical protein
MWCKWVSSDREVSPVAKVVAWIISTHFNRNSRVAFPGERLLADECGMPRTTVQRAILELVMRGYLKKTERDHRAGGRSSSIYAPAEVPEDVGHPGPPRRATLAQYAGPQEPLI